MSEPFSDSDSPGPHTDFDSLFVIGEADQSALVAKQQQQAGWVTLIGRGLSLVNWLVLLTSALLCHKDTAQGTQSPLLGAFLAFRWFFIAQGRHIIDSFRA